MYTIYRGRIKSVDKLKIKDNITTYTIWQATNTLGNKPLSKIFYNISHGYQMQPENSSGVFGVGTLVYFIADDSGSTGVILNAVDENPGSKQQLKASLKDSISTIFQTTDQPPVTPSDFFWSKFDAMVLYGYSGLLKLRSKLGLEFILNPVLNLMTLISRKIRINFSGLEQNVLEFGFQDESKGEVNINLAFVTDTTGTNKDASLINLKTGQLSEKDKRLLFTVVDYQTKDIKTKLLLDKDGNIELKLKSCKINLNDKTEIEITEDGKAFIKTEELYLGKGTTDQPFIRGKDFAKNYKSMLKLIREHRHPANGVQSFDLIGLSNLELESDKELSKNKFLD